MTKQEFEVLHSELESSGNSIKEFMTMKGLPVHRYYYWKKRYTIVEPDGMENDFIQLSPGLNLNSVVRLEYPNGVILNFQSYPGAKALRKLIKNKS